MPFTTPAAALCAALLLAAAGPAAADTAHVPLTLPAVSVVRPPDPSSPDDQATRLGRMAGHTALPRIAGEQPMLAGDPATLAAKRAELGRARAAQSARTRALHGLGVDASPVIPGSR